MKNVLAFISAALIATSGEWSKIWSDALGPDGKVNWAKLSLSFAGVVVAAILVQMNRKLPEQKKDGGFAKIAVLSSFIISMAIIGAGFYQAGCATTGPGKFVNAVVECGEDAVQKNPTIASNVRSCLLGVVAGGYSQCLAMLPFTIDEIVCVVSELSRGTAKAINGGDADPQLAVINRNANAWLRENNVSRK